MTQTSIKIKEAITGNYLVFNVFLKDEKLVCFLRDDTLKTVHFFNPEDIEYLAEFIKFAKDKIK
jgi:hypothetical protein